MSRRLTTRLDLSTKAGASVKDSRTREILPPPRHPSLATSSGSARTNVDGRSSAIACRPGVGDGNIERVVPVKDRVGEKEEPRHMGLPNKADPKVEALGSNEGGVANPAVENEGKVKIEIVGEKDIEEETGQTIPGRWQKGRKSDPDEDDGLRRQLEDEEIERYLESFGKHVHHLRVQPEQAPSTSSHLFNRSSGRQRDSTLPQVLPKTPSKTTPLEPFSISRLRSNAQRLYVVAQPAYTGLATTLIDLCMWKNPISTAVIATIYLALVFTSLLFPAVAGLPLVLLLKRRLWCPSLVDEYKASRKVKQREREAHDVLDGILEGQRQGVGEPNIRENGRGSDGFGVALGVKIDLSRAKEMGESVGVNMGGDRPGRGGGSSGDRKAEQEEQTKESKKGRTVKSAITQIEEDYGAVVVHILGDIADMHEKVKNLYLWRDPQASTSAAIVLSFCVLVSYFIPPWLLVKLVELGVGVIAFVVVPIMARVERTEGYEPIAWLAGPAPTDAEYAMNLIRKRAELGQPLIPRPRPSLYATNASERFTLSITNTDNSWTATSTTRSGGAEGDQVSPMFSLSTPTSAGGAVGGEGGWSRVTRFVETGGRWLENSRRIVIGEKEVSVALVDAGTSCPKSRAANAIEEEEKLIPSRGSDIGSTGEVGIGERVESIMTLRWGSTGPGLVLTQKDKSVGKPVSYFAQYGASPGSLVITTEKVVFTPLIPKRGEEGGRLEQGEAGVPEPPRMRAEVDVESESRGVVSSGPEIQTGTESVSTMTKLTQSVNVTMKDIVGIRKRDKVSLFVVIASGLEIELVNGQRVVFTIVSNRDEAFHRLLALSNKSFTKV